MSIVRLENVSKTFGGDFVLDKVDFRVEKGDKIGLIGRNGTGKSTLFKLITGEVEPDGGTIERMRKAKISYLAQLPDLDPTDTVFDTVMHSFSEMLELEKSLMDLEQSMGNAGEEALAEYDKRREDFEFRGGYEFRTSIERVLHGLGFRVKDYGLSVGALSGGQLARLMLALALLEEAELLLLDEPENHLDLEAREWVEAYLKDFDKAVVIISHDRLMLNSVATRIVEVERSKLNLYIGNYDAHLEQKALQLEQLHKAYGRQQDLIEKEQKWIERFRYKARKAKQVQSRVKRLAKLDKIDAPKKDSDGIRLKTAEVVRSGQVVLDAVGMAKSYDTLTLYKNVSFQIQRGERVCIIGPNGTGKTTMLRQLAGILPDAKGDVSVGHKVKLGYFEQQHEGLNEEATVLNELCTVPSDMSQEQLRTYLGRFLFTGDDVFQTISTLSGGERSRVAIAKLLLSEANVLLLDEPTNHLDIDSREALEAALDSFTGTMVIVSHDRALIDRFADRLILVEGGKASIHLGNYTDYIETVELAQAVSDDKKGPAAPKASSKLAARKERAATRELNKESILNRRRLEKIESTIMESEKSLKGLEAKLYEINPTNYAALGECQREYAKLKSEIEKMYSTWEELSENLSAEKA